MKDSTDKIFALAITLWIIGSLISIGLTVSIIYLVIKFAGSL